MKEEKAMIQELTKEEMAEIFGGAISEANSRSGGRFKIIAKEDGTLAIISA